MSTDPTTDFRYDGHFNAGQLARLLDAVGDLPITDHERRTLHWLSGWEPATIEVGAGLGARAGSLPRRARHR